MLHKPNVLIFVTGGTGFIGSYIIKNLVEKGHRVRAIRRSAALPFYIPKNLLEQVEWIDGDILDVDALSQGMEGVTHVVHAAAMVSFLPADRRQLYKVNVEGTANVVNAAVEQGVGRIVHISSVAALGRGADDKESVSESKAWVESKNNTHYAISKRHAEVEVWRGFAEGLEGVIVNPSTVLGYGDWHRSSLAIFKSIYNGFPWYTRGINGFVGVDDVAEASVRLLLSGVNEQRFIISADNWSFEKLFTTIAEAFEKKPPHRFATRQAGALVWRMERLKSSLTGSKPLVTKETATVAHMETRFDNSKLLEALPGFSYTSLENVIKNACEKYKAAVKEGELHP